MANAKSTTPALRFKGFDAEWEERQLGDIAEKVTRTDPSSTAPVMMITADNGFIKQSDRYAFNNSGQSLTKYIVLKRKELAYNHGASKLRPYGSCFALPYKEARVPFVYHCFSVDNDSPDFISIQLNGTAVEAELRKIVSSGARMDGLLNISYEAYSKVPIFLPNPDEQGVVANYFNNLDNLIALQRRKLVQLQNVKKAMLQKMFPTRGSTTPQIRFAGFTEPWQERKLGDISDIKTGPFGSTLHAGDYVSEGAAIITTEHFKNGELPEGKNDIPQVSKQDERRLQAYVLKTDDIVFSRVGSVDINALITPHQNGWLFSGRVLRVRTNKAIDSQYLHYELSTERARNDVIGRAVGQTMPSINTEILKQTTVYSPTKIDEQIKIGIYFKHLDTRISLQQRKLEKLQNVKKACLAAMFV